MEQYWGAVTCWDPNWSQYVLTRHSSTHLYIYPKDLLGITHIHLNSTRFETILKLICCKI